MIKKIITYYKRRVSIPVDKSALVLDIGSGDNPHWRADVLLDMYPSDEYLAQRRGKTLVNKPVFEADAGNMPFADKSFDYVICSHLLEHVPDPGQVIKEIMRVGKAGYIEVLYEGSSKITDFESHLWYCKKEREKLIFTAKQQVFFDDEIDHFVRSPEIQKALGIMYVNNFEKCIVSVKWTENVDFEINGKANMHILEESLDTPTVKPSMLLYALRKSLFFIFSILLFSKQRRDPVYYNQIVKEQFWKKIDLKLKHEVYRIPMP